MPLKNEVLRLTEANKWLKKDKVASKASCSSSPALLSHAPTLAPSSSSTPAACAQALPPFFLYCQYFLYALSSLTLILSPNFPLSLTLSPDVHFFSDPIRTCLFKIKPSEDTGAKSLISYIPWTKAELQRCSQVTKDPHRFAEEFNIVTQTYQPGFSDLHQLVHMLVREGQAQHWMKTPNCENPESSLELQLDNH